MVPYNQKTMLLFCLSLISCGCYLSGKRVHNALREFFLVRVVNRFKCFTQNTESLFASCISQK